MNTFQLYQTMFCFGQIISIDSNSFGVGLSINQLNNIKHQFDQVNNVKSKAAINKGIYQNKYHNFSEKFSLEDRLLLVRLYNRYTEENCMTFKTFARKFKRKANEWINSNNEETMWEHEHIRKQKSLKLFDGMEGFQDFTDLESFTEEELLELLQSLENDEMLNEIENQIQSQSSIDNDSLSTEDDDETLDNIFANETNASDAQRQGQEQSQQVRAEIHTHNHYYLIQQQDGSIQELSEFSNTDPAMVQAMLNSTQSPVSSMTSSSCSCPSSSSSSHGPGMMYPSPGYPMMASAPDISLTTSSPQEQSGVSTTVAQTTLPPVQRPGTNNNPGATVSSLPADLPETIPTPEARNGVYSCGRSSAGMTTNFVNPSYPGTDSTTGECKFYLVLNSDVCQVRVDFVDTSMLAPVEGKCSQQSLSVGGTVWPLGVSNFCGRNSDQHFYIEVARTGASSYVEFTVDTKINSAYKWGLWITQITCDGTRTIQAPTGCFQYYFDTSGQIKSYNYDGGQYYTDQHYRICLLTSSQACQVEFSTDGPFMLEKWGNFKTNPYTRAGVTSQYCVKDYLQIPGGSNREGTLTHDRFCGGQLSTNHGARASEAVIVGIRGPLVTIEFHSGTPKGQWIEEHHKPGFRVQYQQQACV